MEGEKRLSKKSNILCCIGSILILGFLLFPLFWIFITSLKTEQEIFQNPPTFYPHVLNTKSYAAQLERENIHQRQREGIREAQKKGVRFGRPTMPLPENYEEVREMWRKGDISLRQGARLLGTTHATFSKWLRETS